MARLWSSGFESNSTTANVEFTSVTGAGTSIQTSTIRSGAYAGQCNPSSATSFFTYRFLNSASSAAFYFRAYIRFATLPDADVALWNCETAGGSTSMQIRFIQSTSKLILRDNGAVTIGTSAAITTNTWYALEIMQDDTNTTSKARLDGVEFASSTTVTAGNINPINQFNIGFIGSGTGNLFLDDFAVNDDTGSFQNSWAGSGKILHLKPNASGDANSFATQVGGTAGSSNNYTRVNEVTPDDATSYNGSLILNQEDLFNVDDSGVGASDTVNVVAVGGRFADLVAADATSGIQFEIEKTSGGTKSLSANIVPNTATWNTNATAAPRNYPLTTYQDPDSSNWTQTTLDSMQIGYILDAIAVRSVAVSTVWALVDYTPAAATTTSTSSTSSSTSSTSTSISTSSTSSSISTSSTSSSSTSSSISTSTSSTSTSQSTSTSSTSTSSTSTSRSTSTSSTSKSTSTSSTSTSKSTSTSSTSKSTSTSSTSTSKSTSTSSTSRSTSTSLSTSTSSTSTSTTGSTTTSTSSTSSSTSSTSSSTSSTTTLPLTPFKAIIMQRIFR